MDENESKKKLFFDDEKIDFDILRLNFLFGYPWGEIQYEIGSPDNSAEDF